MEVVSLRRRWTMVAACLASLGVALVVVVHPAAAAGPADFGDPSADVAFGTGITFSQPVTITSAVTRAEILLGFPGAIGPLSVEVRIPSGSGQTTLRHVHEALPGDLTPNTRIEARWRLTEADGTESTGPAVAALYADDRFTWRTRVDGLMRLHWYEGDDAFADRALEIAVDGLAAAQSFLGVTETEPVDLFVYGSEDDIYEALAPDRENVGGQAYPAIRTLFALIAPGEIDDPWVGVVLPHEITHLVFDTAVENPYGYPPKWLNEGVAVYLSEGYTAAHRASVEGAADDGTLIPLDGLVGQFPTTFDRFGLAYSESVSAIDYLARTHGELALNRLIASYGEGVGDEEAFRTAIGIEPLAFDAAWRVELGAGEPVVHGPRPGEPGPAPEGWGVVTDQGGSGVPEGAENRPAAVSSQGIALIVASAALALAVVGGLAIRLRRSPSGRVA